MNAAVSLPNCELVLGGARSGKSRHAQAQVENWATRQSVCPIYIATAQAGDAEMAARIKHHKSSRAENWTLDEEPLQLGAAIARNSNATAVILVDCLTLWLSNCLEKQCWEEESEKFFAALASTQARIVLVNNETGMGVVPLGKLTRDFVDANGFLNQRLASLCGKVVLVVAGIPQVLKQEV